MPMPTHNDLQGALAADLQQMRLHLQGEPALTDLRIEAEALNWLRAVFGLSDFETRLVTLCAGLELEADFSELCLQAHSQPLPTFRLALRLFPSSDWGAITPDSPLRYWRMIDIAPGSTLLDSPLKLDERILHHLMGSQPLDERLTSYIEPVMSSRTSFTPAQTEQVGQIAASLTHDSPIIQLTGSDTRTITHIAEAACRMNGHTLYRLPLAVAPTNPAELDALIRLWHRETCLSHRALLIDCHMGEATVPRDRLLAGLSSPLLVSTRERLDTGERFTLAFAVEKPSTADQRQLWQAALNGHPGSDAAIDRLIGQFDLSSSAIAAGALVARSRPGSSDIDARLWQAARDLSRPQLSQLAQMIDARATWDDLILPEPQKQILTDIATQARHRFTVYEQWGFARTSQRGLGISALFAGPSGTGKTMAGEVLANELDLDLYRIDLSAVVSKYIGETEKNLRQVFDAAENGGALLLFDEADALFGKRSEVRDSHDRYANIEISYLLQRMEAYRGVTILTTNMKDTLDSAFLRRLRFVVRFPFPTTAQRAAIWAAVFPAETPTDRLDYSRLAQLNIAGGNIRNIALNAAFNAASAGDPVGMGHILTAARAEYAKLERSLTDAEIRDWL